MKINNKRELQNIAVNHSADIDYKDFLKTYTEYTKEPFNFLTIDITLPAKKAIIIMIKVISVVLKVNQLKKHQLVIMMNLRGVFIFLV